MKIDQILAELEQVTKAQSVRVSYEAIGGELGAGGLCKVKGEWRVIIDKRATPGERASVLAQALSRFPVNEAGLSDPVRELLRRSRPAQPAEPPPAPASGDPR